MEMVQARWSSLIYAGRIFCEGFYGNAWIPRASAAGIMQPSKRSTVITHRVSILRPAFHISICSFPYFLMKRVCFAARVEPYRRCILEMRGITERRYGDACRRGGGRDCRRTCFMLGSSGAADRASIRIHDSFIVRSTLCPSRYSAHIPTSPFCYPPNLPNCLFVWIVTHALIKPPKKAAAAFATAALD